MSKWFRFDVKVSRPSKLTVICAIPFKRAAAFEPRVTFAQRSERLLHTLVEECARYGETKASSALTHRVADLRITKDNLAVAEIIVSGNRQVVAAFLRWLYLQSGMSMTGAYVSPQSDSKLLSKQLSLSYRKPSWTPPPARKEPHQKHQKPLTIIVNDD